MSKQAKTPAATPSVMSDVVAEFPGLYLYDLAPAGAARVLTVTADLDANGEVIALRFDAAPGKATEAAMLAMFLGIRGLRNG